MSADPDLPRLDLPTLDSLNNMFAEPDGPPKLRPAVSGAVCYNLGKFMHFTNAFSWRNTPDLEEADSEIFGNAIVEGEMDFEARTTKVQGTGNIAGGGMDEYYIYFITDASKFSTVTKCLHAFFELP